MTLLVRYLTGQPLSEFEEDRVAVWISLACWGAACVILVFFILWAIGVCQRE